MDQSLFTHPGFIGGMIGVLVGLLGGIIGTYCSYRKARSHQERVWILFYAIAIIVFCLALIVTLLSTSGTTWLIFHIGYPVAMVASVLGINRHLNRLHQNHHE